MKLKKSLAQGLIIGGLLLAATFVSHPARANVYASNIKLDGGATNVLAAIGDSVTITYILNEPASRGVTVKILSGGSVVRSLSLAADGPGAQQGLNSVVWDGRDANSNNVAPGTYSVSITAASSGYTNWTQTTVDNDTTYLWFGQGIAVDQNTNSVYYGRIFAGNSEAGPNFNPGDVVGILKMNADGSPADEGILSTNQSGHTWTDNDLSPWKLTVSVDDYVYVDDLANGGEVYRWDPTFSRDTLLYVLQLNNQPTSAHLSGPAVAGTGTNAQIWMADFIISSTHGILKWGVTSNETCVANDKGTSVVGLGTNQSFSAVALDKYGNIYTCQPIAGSGDPNPRVFMYPGYDPSTNGNLPQTNPAWAVGAGDDTYGGASGLAVDPTGTYLAVAFQGISPNGLPVNGNTKILYATNGALVTNLDLNVPMDGQQDLEHENTDCAWDAVGNVYYIDNWYGFWRAFSPPGTNQSTTVAVMQVLVQSPPAPVITGVSVATNTVTLLFTGSTSDTATNFTVVSSAVVTGGYSASTATFSQLSPGTFRATVPVNGPTRFYRIRR